MLRRTILLSLFLIPIFDPTAFCNQKSNISSIIPLLAQWRLVDRVPIQFNAFHTQGLVKIGPHFYLSAVEVLKKTSRTKSWKTGFSRTIGEGVGHLFEFNAQGELLREITLGEGSMYHPGGMDFDGRWIWIPVSEYRPNSFSIIYKVDPETLQVVEAFRVTDSIGGVVFNREFNTIVGLNWGAKYFYEWTPDGKMLRKEKNDTDEVAYQDCKYVQGPAMVCSGIFGNAMGRLDLIDLMDFSRIIGMWSVPRTPHKILMTRNPMTLEKTDDKTLYYFLPEDNFGTLYIYELW